MAADTSTLKTMSALKLALLAKQVREQSQAVLQADPIAVIGLGCRLPGGVDGPESYWRVLRDGVDAVSDVPAGRWDVDAVYDPDPAAPGKAAARSGGFIGGIDMFDAGFFGILPREAERMDPQQRLFLEVAVEALDHAGLPRHHLAGSRTGVFIASYYNDYAHLQYRDPETIDSRTLTGTVHSVLANRLSYLLDLRGPSVSVDTACSSSLVAIHLACQSLRSGESDVALAGGVSLMISEGMMISLSKVGFMAPDGRCKAFDASANGFGRGEGCGVVVLKRLSDAIADGDRVLALVRGSAVNQDGHSTVLAAPNGLAQQALIREALENAQIDAARIGYVEAHGTGTALGDPIEVEALAATVGVPAEGAGECLVGTAKANIAHLEAAAGVAGFIKSVLVLQHDAVPPQVHFRTLSPHIRLEGTRLRIPTQLTSWPAGRVPRCIGTSGFGVGGTNAHVILEEAPRLPTAPVEQQARRERILPISAQSEAALRALASRWVEFLARPDTDFAAVCAAAGQRRSHYDHRFAAVAADAAQMTDLLRRYLDDAPPIGFAAGRRPTGAATRLAFVFGGQGQQWVGMGQELLRTEPVFRESLDRIDREFRRHGTLALLEELSAPNERSRLADTEVAQPAIFAIQVGLAALWRAWGVEPDGVVGHSIGEIAALHVAGALSLEDAVRVVWQRARSMQRATGLGGMAAVPLSEAEAAALISGFGGRLSIGAVNSPRSVVLSGESEALALALGQLEARGIPQRTVPVNYAFHSAQMAPFARELATAVRGVQMRTSTCAVYSTVDGRRIATDGLDAEYFARNVAQPVRFAAALTAMLDDGFVTFVEIGAHPVLAVSIGECAAGREDAITSIASLRRERPERATVLQGVCGVYAANRVPNWEALDGRAASVVDLPAYPWQRERFWIRERASATPSIGSPPTKTTASVGRGLLGQSFSSADAVVFEASWPGRAPDWLEDHRIGGRLLVPGMAMLEALRDAATYALRTPDILLREFVVHRPLILGEGDEPEVAWQVAASRQPDGSLRLTLHQAEGASEARSWRLVASASAQGSPAAAQVAMPPALDPGAVAAGSSASAGIYAAFDSLGARFGPRFRVLAAVRPAGATIDAWLRRDAGGAAADGVDATLLDGALQACVCGAAGDGGLPKDLLLPMGVDALRCRAPLPDELRMRAELRRAGSAGSITASIHLWSSAGELVASLEGVRFAPASAEALAAMGRSDPWLHEVVWQEAGRGAASDPEVLGAWIVLADAAGYGDALAQALQQRGYRCRSVRHPSATGQSTDAGSPDARESLLDFDAMLRDESWRGGEPLCGIAHLWSLDLEPAAAAPELEHGIALDAGDDLASASAMRLLQAVIRRSDPAVRIAMVTRGSQPAGGAVPRPQGAALWGLHAAAAAEQPDLDLRAIDLDADAPTFDAAALAFELTRPLQDCRRVALRGARRLVPQLRRCPPASQASRPEVLVPDGSGTLEGLAWRELSPRAPAPGEVRVRVVAAGINFRDVLLSLGMYPGSGATLGAECAGIVDAVGDGVDRFAPGDAVFGFARDSLATHVTVPAAFLAPVPRERLSLEQAAALPAAFMTALYGLGRIADLRAGQRILIHAAAGGVGMAAVQLAQRAGAEVFATAGSPAKRELLASLGVRHVLDSRSLAFADEILRLTGGTGVDVVLNSLSGEFIDAGVRSLARGGCFLELGKRGVWSAAQFAQLRPDARYCIYDLGERLEARPELAQDLLGELVTALRDGSLRPLPVRTFAAADAGDALRLMAQAQHVGKLVLSMPGAAGGQIADGAGPIRADATYLVTGGLGALGQQSAAWLVERGARNLVLVARRTPTVAELAKIRVLEGLGARIVVRSADVGDGAALKELLAWIARELPPLRGVIHAAGVLEDGVLLRQDSQRLARALRGKAHGAFLLHALTASQGLDFFVLYSAAGLLLGPSGQAPYAAANAQLDALAHARRAAGLPALSIGWGMWSGAGMAADLPAAGRESWTSRGLGWIDPAGAFARLGRLLENAPPHVAVMAMDWSRFATSGGATRDPSFFARVTPRRESVPSPGPSQAGPTRLAQWRAMAQHQRRDAVAGHALESARQVLGLPAGVSLDARAALKDLGLDSLMAVELRNSLTRSIGHSLPATLLFDYPSIEALVAYLLKTLQLEEPPPSGAESQRAERAIIDLAALSDAEAEAQLLAELGEGSREAGK